MGSRTIIQTPRILGLLYTANFFKFGVFHILCVSIIVLLWIRIKNMRTTKKVHKFELRVTLAVIVVLAIVHLPYFLTTGPRSFPILGGTIEMFLAHPTQAYKAFQKLRDRYGDIFRLQMGVVPSVVFHGYDNIREVLGSTELLNRQNYPHYTERHNGKCLGITLSRDFFWTGTRTFTTRTLKSFGFGSNPALEPILRTSFLNWVRETLDPLIRADSGKLSSHNLFSKFTIDIMSSIVFGNPLPKADLRTDTLPALFHTYNLTGAQTGFGFNSAFPFIMKLAPGWSGFKTYQKVSTELRKYFQGLVKEAKRNPSSNFVNIFLQNGENGNSDDIKKGNTTQPIFTEENLVAVLMDIFFGGSSCLAISINFAILHLIKNPEKQNKLYMEIVKAVGRDRMATYGDKPRLAYAEATVMEVLRLSNIIPVVSRVPLRPYKFKGHTIEKGTLILANVYDAHMDEGIWAESKSFRPERFIGEQGEIIHSERLLAFGMGKRVCPAELTSRTSIFLILTWLIQMYKFEIDPGAGDLSDDVEVGMTLSPAPYKFVARKRLDFKL